MWWHSIHISHLGVQAATEPVIIHPVKQLTRYCWCLQKLWCEGIPLEAVITV